MTDYTVSTQNVLINDSTFMFRIKFMSDDNRVLLLL